MSQQTIIEATAPRVLPKLTDANRLFWTGGSTGRLLVPRCGACQKWVLPPPSACPGCGGPVTFEAVSGKATVYTYTVNAHQFHPEVPPPTIIAIVQLAEQEDLLLATNLVRCSEDAVSCGMAVRVLFERHGEVYYPLFQPAAEVA